MSNGTLKLFAWAGLAWALAGSVNAWAGSSTVHHGSTVSLHYTLTVDQKVVDSSVGRSPLTYIQGSSQIVTGLEEQLAGLKKGDKRRITVSPDKGYGPIFPDAYQNVPRKSIPNSKKLKVGDVVTGQFEGGPVRATILDLDKKNVALNLNHPLAGKTLEFDVEVVNVK